jgi:hypothetical protein
MSATIEYWHASSDFPDGGTVLSVDYTCRQGYVQVTAVRNEDGKPYDVPPALLNELEHACADDARDEQEHADWSRALQQNYCQPIGPMGTEHDPDPDAYWRG